MFPPDSDPEQQAVRLVGPICGTGAARGALARPAIPRMQQVARAAAPIREIEGNRASGVQLSCREVDADRRAGEAR